MVPDRAEVLTGEIGPGEEALAVRTRQRLLVELATWYIRHSLAVAAIVSDLGSRLGELLKAETQSILSSIDPGEQGAGWLEHMVRLAGCQSDPATCPVDDPSDARKSPA
jgi:hypothetical protein